MAIKHLSDDDVRIVGECLVAAVKGPFFPEWEFHTLFGLDRKDLVPIMQSWPHVREDDETVVLAVNNTLGNLVGYPHGEDLSRFVSAAPEHLMEILARWQAVSDPDSLDPDSLTIKSRSVEGLVGEAVSGVAFVQDYVEFHFDGPILRALQQVRLVSNAGTYTFPETGSRDALCSLIGHVVQNVSIHERDRIEVRFDGGRLLEISLIVREGGWPEAAHFVTGRNSIEVW